MEEVPCPSLATAVWLPLLLPRDLPKASPTFLLFGFCLSWGTDAEEEEKRGKIYSEQVQFTADEFGCRRVVCPSPATALLAACFTFSYPVELELCISMN